MNTAEVRQARWAGLFATPVLSHFWANGSELNGPLRESILDHAGAHPGANLTSVGGWHSDPGMLEFCADAGRELIRHMSEMVEEATRRLFADFSRPARPVNWILSAWANVNRQGDFNQMHTHPGATWSGVYFVDHGEATLAAEGTALRLSDPNPARTNIFFPELSASDVLFKPEPGLMVVFPSYVPHSVLPHRGDRPRISIAFNVRKEPFP